MAERRISGGEGRPRFAVQSHLLDIVLGVLGTAMGWVSLLFPFGRDQGLYYYVAREWVLRGAIPYRDLLDHKTPGIYLLHALAVRLFGEVMWGIRLLDLIAVLLTGFLAATIVAPRGARPAPGLRGACVLTTNVLFFGFLDFWNTSQSEVWYSMLGLACVAAALRITRLVRAELAVGAAAGAAMLMKPPSLWFVLLALVVVLLRHREARLRNSDGISRLRRLTTAGARLGAGAMMVVAPVLLYFAAHRALAAMKDIVVGANSYYVRHESDVRSIGDVGRRIWDAILVYNPVAAAIAVMWLIAMGAAVGRGDKLARGRHLMSLSLCAAGFAAVAMQAKFYLLHWTVMLGPVVVVCADVMTSLAESIPRLRGRMRAPLAFTAILLFSWALSGPSVALYLDETRLSIGYLRGSVPHHEFSDFFKLPMIGFWWADSEMVGVWLRDHSRPEDLLTVRGFQPEIYAVAQRRHEGRFFWTTFLTAAARAYRREEWLAEDLRALKEHPPRFIVTLTNVHEGPDSTEFFRPLGYEPREVVNELTILERTPEP